MKRWDNIFEVLKGLKSRYPAFSNRLKEAEALGRWEMAVGPGIAKHTRAIRVQDSVLWVEVDHPIWKSELHHRKRQILEVLNAGNLPDQTQKKKVMAPAEEVLSDIFFVDPKRQSR